MVKSNEMASSISHAEDCILDVQYWLEKNGENPDSIRMVNMRQALDLLSEVYHDLQEE